MNFQKEFKRSLEENIETHLKTNNSIKQINQSIREITKAIRRGNKILLCGNGGSAADAQHLAAEFLVRLRPHINREPIPAISLAQDTSTITACSNDYKFDEIFTRTFQALAKKGDILIAISTSGNSKNILKVLNYARKKKHLSIALLGKNGGKAKKLADISIIIDSSNTARIQESHIFIGHFIFEQVENLFIKK